MTRRLLALCLLISLILTTGCALSLPTPTPVATATLTRDLLATPEVEPSAAALQTQRPTATQTPSRTSAPTPTRRPIGTPSPARTPTPRNTPTPIPTVCAKNISWFSYIIQSGDTLGRLAQLSDTTVAALMEANCLLSDTIIAGSRLYVPREIRPPANPTDSTGAEALTQSAATAIAADLTATALAAGQRCSNPDESCGGGFATPKSTDTATIVPGATCVPGDETCGDGLVTPFVTSVAFCRPENQSCGTGSD